VGYLHIRQYITDKEIPVKTCSIVALPADGIARKWFPLAFTYYMLWQNGRAILKQGDHTRGYRGGYSRHRPKL